MAAPTVTGISRMRAPFRESPRAAKPLTAPGPMYGGAWYYGEDDEDDPVRAGVNEVLGIEIDLEDLNIE